jgi:SAM-dependent methyltransferase
MSELRPAICDYEGSTYQQDFWGRGERQYEDQAEALALRHLLPPSGDLLLEIGAGAGRNTPRYGGFQRVVLLDYSRTQLEQAQARLGTGGGYIYVAADAYRLPFVPGLFDAATMIRVIHHLADAPAALRQVRAVLRPGGAFVLEFASKLHLKAIARWLLRRQAWSPFDRQPVEFVALNFDFHPGAMLGWLNEMGLCPRQVRAVSYFRMPLLKRLLPLGWLVALDGLFQPTGQVLQLSPSVFVRADAPAGGPSAPAGAFFRCPACGGGELWPSPPNPLSRPRTTRSGEGEEEHGYLHCVQCSRRWEVRGGIYDFREPAQRKT